MEEPEHGWTWSIAMILDSWKSTPAHIAFKFTDSDKLDLLCKRFLHQLFVLCLPLCSSYFLTLNILQHSTLPTRRSDFVAGLQLCRVGNGCATGRADTPVEGLTQRPRIKIKLKLPRWRETKLWCVEGWIWLLFYWIRLEFHYTCIVYRSTFDMIALHRRQGRTPT